MAPLVLDNSCTSGVLAPRVLLACAHVMEPILFVYSTFFLVVGDA
jgi:hypothetical protein